ncbi:hypothetical protein [Mesorhizobium sp. M0590]|uniref:hypothetical protein n=1 Tax=Mesorhizobium sp. M0590 TaxID=2956966 RepID=UPI0033394A7A
MLGQENAISNRLGCQQNPFSVGGISQFSPIMPFAVLWQWFSAHFDKSGSLNVEPTLGTEIECVLLSVAFRRTEWVEGRHPPQNTARVKIRRGDRIFAGPKFDRSDAGLDRHQPVLGFLDTEAVLGRILNRHSSFQPSWRIELQPCRFCAGRRQEAPFAGRRFWCFPGRKPLERPIKTIVLRFGAEHGHKCRRDNLHRHTGLEDDRLPTGIGLHLDRRLDQHRLRVRRHVEGQWDPRRPASLAAHAKPVEEPAEALLRYAVKSLRDLRLKLSGDLEHGSTSVASLGQRVPFRQPHARAIEQFLFELRASALVVLRCRRQCHWRRTSAWLAPPSRK